MMMITEEYNMSMYPDNLTWIMAANDTVESSSNQFEQPWWKQVMWTCLYAPMVVVATGGNLIVIWIVLAHKRMRTVTNYFLVNLSLADAMVSTLNVTFNFVYMLSSDWPFGRFYCKVTQFVAVLSICASVFTLMAIAVDRYIAIIYPLKPRVGRRTTLCIALGIWIGSIILSLPSFLYFTTDFIEYVDGSVRTVCYPEWPDGPNNYSRLELIYNVMFMILTYFLPIFSMLFTYARIGKELWGSQSIGECTQRQLENIKSKRRVVKMMMVVVTIFVVCWMPFQIYFLMTSYWPEITNEAYIQDIYLAIYWLAMSNSMYNPIIYCWMNSRFRQGFKQFFRWCPGVHATPDGLTRREVLTARYNYSCSGSPDGHYRIKRGHGKGERRKAMAAHVNNNTTHTGVT
uniref:Tachykinin-like peptides receptor 99D n=1 Tax=Cacopsylla melanoneura TaxID=428564 RepID=A0A8D8WXB2_9HEMI